MSLQNLYAGSYGALQTHSLAVSFDFSRKEMSRFYSRYGRENVIHEEEVNWSSFKQEDRNLYLTDIHEFDHFAQLLSTPAGILIWRLYQVLLRDLNFLATTYTKASIEVNCCGQSLVTWYQQQGRKQLASALQNKPDGIALISYLDYEVLPGIQNVDRLLDLLTCLKPWKDYAEYTVAEFTELINFVFPYLSRRCMIPWNAVWDSRRNPSDKLFPNSERGVNLRGILETVAYSKEYRALTRMKATEADFTEWERNRLPSEYKSSFKYFMSLFGDASHLRGFFSRALLGRIDLCAYSGSKQVLYVEEEWPWWRSEIISNDDALLNMLRCGLDSLHTIASRRKLYGPRSWQVQNFDKWEKNHSIPSLAQDYQAHLDRLDKAYIRAAQVNLNCQIQRIKGDQSISIQNDILKEILLIEYKDEFIFKQPDKVFQDMIAAVYFGSINSVSICVVRGNFAISPVQTGEKLARSIEHIGRGLEQNGVHVAELILVSVEKVKLMFTQKFFEQHIGLSNVVWKN